MQITDWIIPLRIVDFVEIAAVSYILYKLYRFMRGTIALQILLGLVALYVVQVIVTAVDMTMLPALFASIGEVAVLAVIILFQPEIRRVLLLLGRNPLIRRFVRSAVREQTMKEVLDAVDKMSTNRVGALIAFERSSGLRNYTETGVAVKGAVSCDLLIAIFHGQNPLHDGAVIISGDRLEAARCILPVSSNIKPGGTLGLRHRAAAGLSEQTDAVVVVVSEETGAISVSVDGELRRNLSADALEASLAEAFTHRPGHEPPA